MFGVPDARVGVSHRFVEDGFVGGEEALEGAEGLVLALEVLERVLQGAVLGLEGGEGGGVGGDGGVEVLG